MYSLALIIFVVSEKKAFEHCPIGSNVNYKLYVFCSDMKFKMAATAGLSLTLDPMGEMFQNASSLKPLEQLKPNCPGMIIGRSSGDGHLEFPIGIKKQKLCRGPSNDHSWAVWFQLSKWFQRRNVLKHFSHRVQC
jgi:hypothetical protein